MSSCLKTLAFSLVLLTLLPSAPAAEVEAIKGKTYTLSKQHGPWMIMVAAIRDVEEERRIKGMSAADAANELVYELRRKKVPAFIHVMGDTTSVLAGDYKDSNDKDLTRALQYIKTKFHPAFLKEEKDGALKNGGLFAKTPGRSGPLSKAFVTVNPLLSPEEVKRMAVDSEGMKLLVALNSDMDYSLLRNKGRYSLVIATFSGNAIVQVGNQTDAGAMARFEKSFGSNLDKSGEEAWALTQALRSAKKAGYDQNYEAWVFHDKYRSYVTIGSFDDASDPAIQTLATQFRAKDGRHPVTGEDMLTPEIFTVPRKPADGKVIDRMWIFDGNPRLMEVPRVRK